MTGLDLALEKPEEEAGGTRAGVGEVHVRIGVVDRQAVDLPEHAVGENPVQVERDDDGDLRAGHAADFAEEMALRIEFALGPHRAVKGHVDAVDLVEPLLDRRRGVRPRAGAIPRPTTGRRFRPVRRMSGRWSMSCRASRTASAPPIAVLRPRCA